MPSTSDDARRELLAAAARVLEVTEGRAPGPFTVIIASGRAFTIPSEPPSGPTDPAQFSTLQRALYNALAGGPLSARTLARLVRRRYNSHFRKVLSQLVKAGLIHRVVKGYARSQRLFS